MAQCTNCGALVGCSCSLISASNGIKCCPNCIHSYEQKLRDLKNLQQQVLQPFVHPREHLYKNG